MNSVEKYSGKILDSAAIKATQTHYELGNIILQECIKNYSIINLEQINKLLIEIDNIGNYYKDLLVISTSDLKNLQLDETEKIIENINNIIDKNSEIDMTFLTKILEKINGDYERACYINNLEEQNDIKAGLIISNNLHAQLLADWANKFASIQINNNINEYIAQNPVTIEYSETNITNKSVKATIKTNAENIRQEQPIADMSSLMKNPNPINNNKFFVDLDMKDDIIDVMNNNASTKVKTATDALNKSINDLKLQGINVYKEEMDLGNAYQITIRIDK